MNDNFLFLDDDRERVSPLRGYAGGAGSGDRDYYSFVDLYEYGHTVQESPYSDKENTKNRQKSTVYPEKSLEERNIIKINLKFEEGKNRSDKIVCKRKRGRPRKMSVSDIHGSQELFEGKNDKDQQGEASIKSKNPKKLSMEKFPMVISSTSVKQEDCKSHSGQLTPYEAKNSNYSEGCSDSFASGFADEESGIIKDIYVLQCNMCLHIVGDTLSHLHMDRNLGTITLKRKSESVVLADKTKYQKSKRFIDYRSSYSDLTCRFCNNQIGRLYHTTPSSLMCLANFFTYDMKKVVMYRIGCTSSEDVGIDVENNDYADIPKLKQDLEQMQKLFVYCYKEIKRLDAISSRAL